MTCAWCLHDLLGEHGGQTGHHHGEQDVACEDRSAQVGRRAERKDHVQWILRIRAPNGISKTQAEEQVSRCHDIRVYSIVPISIYSRMASLGKRYSSSFPLQMGHPIYIYFEHVESYSSFPRANSTHELTRTNSSKHLIPVLKMLSVWLPASSFDRHCRIHRICESQTRQEEAYA